MSVVLIPTVQELRGVPKKGQPRAGRPSIGRQVNIRLSDPLVADLEYIADSLDADLSHVIRSILAEHTPEHVHRAKQIRERQEAARKAKDES